MKLKSVCFMSLTLSFLLVGCSTPTVDPVAKSISWTQQKAYLSRVRDPRIFGLSIYETPGGLQLRGGGRLHPRQAAALSMEFDDPLRPVVALSGGFNREWPVLIDLVSSRSWLAFDAAKKLQATPVAEGKAELIRLPEENISACLSIVSSLRLGQLFIENPLVYVRMADGSLGSLTRGINDRGLKGVIGWDLLKKMEQIRFLYSSGQVVLFTTEPYEPNPAQLIATLPLVKHAGGCAVRGRVNGKETLVLIDPAGDFELGGSASRVDLSPNLSFSSVEPASSFPGIRVGARLLQQYDITLCPKAGLIYFEHPAWVDPR